MPHQLPLIRDIGTEPGQLRPGAIRKLADKIAHENPDYADTVERMKAGMDRFLQLTYALNHPRVGLVESPHNCIPHRVPPDIVAAKEAARAGIEFPPELDPSRRRN